jgi:hypothetical protein
MFFGFMGALVRPTVRLPQLDQTSGVSGVRASGHLAPSVPVEIQPTAWESRW